MPIQPMQFPTSGIESPVLKGLGSANDLLKQALMNQIYGAQAKYAEPMSKSELLGKELQNQLQSIKAKYAEPTAQEELRKLQLYNQYYGPDIQSQIGLRGAETGHLGAETSKLNQMLPGELLAQRLRNQQAQTESQTGTTTGVTPFDRATPEVKNAILSRIMSLGFNEEEAYKHARAGTDLGDLAQMKGYERDLSNAPEPQPLLTTAGRTQLIRSNMANAGLDAADDFINRGTSHYVGQPRIAGTPIGFTKDALLGTNKDKQSDFIASSILATDQGFLRGRSVGAPLSQGLLRHTLQTSLTDVRAQFPLVRPDVFNDAMKKVRRGLDAINKAENEAARGATRKIEKTKGAEISNEDIEFTAQKYNMTPDQVREKLKEQGKL